MRGESKASGMLVSAGLFFLFFFFFSLAELIPFCSSVGLFVGLFVTLLHASVAKETYLYGKRGLFLWQKRPIPMAKETYLYGKRGLLTLAFVGLFVTRLHA